MKRLFALILAVSMLLSMASVGFAEGTHTHDYKYASATTAGYHNITCSGCDYTGYAACNYNADNKCTNCQAAKPADPAAECKHADTEFTNGVVDGVKVHGQKCKNTECGEWVSYTPCTFGSEWHYEGGLGTEADHERACKTCTQTGCGSKKYCEHDFATIWEPSRYDATGNHVHYCKDCGAYKSDFAAHTFACTGMCTECGYVDKDGSQKDKYADHEIDTTAVVKAGTVNDKSGHWYNYCKKCGEYQNFFAHENWRADELPTKAELNSDGTNHWYVCKECDTTFGVEKHTAGDLYMVDAKTHAKKCTVCGYVMMTAAHTLSNAANCNDGALCTDGCGYSVGKLGHDIGYKTTATQHTEYCKREGCTYEGTAENHSTAKVDGKYVYNENGTLTCDVCSAEYADAHKHQLITVKYQAPTCTEVGYEAYTKCVYNGCTYETEKVSIPSLHDQGDCWVFEVMKEGDCTHPTTYWRYCKFYDEEKNPCDKGVPKQVTGAFDENGKFVEDANAKSHSWDKGVKTAADCCNNEYTVYTCTKCGDVKVDVKTGSALGHQLRNVFTWVADGGKDECKLVKVEYKKCSLCGYDEYTKEGREVKCEHKEYPSEVEGETSISKKNDIYDCKCGDKTDAKGEVVETKINSKHVFGNATVTAATCTKTEKTVKVCTVCGYKDEKGGKKIDNSKHAAKNDCCLIGSLPTCTKDGVFAWECPICHEYLNYYDGADGDELEGKLKEVDKLGHEWDNGTHEDAVCNAYGYIVYECERDNCGATITIVHDGIKSANEVDENLNIADAEYEKVEEAKNNHDYSKLGALLYGSDKCGEIGWYELLCSRCGERNVDNKQVTNPHAWALDGKADIEPSCKGDGVKGEGKVKCTKCGKTDYSEDLTADLGLKIDHKFVEKTVPATCTEPAKKGLFCEYCGDSKGTVTVIGEKLGHDKAEKLIEKDCTMAAATLTYCKRCDWYEINKLYATGNQHKAEKIYVNGKPTCEKAAKYYWICTECGQFVDKDGNTVAKAIEYVEDAIGHAYDEKKHVVVAATCVSGGYTSDYCKNCGETFISNKTEAIKNPSAGINGGHKDWSITWKIEGNCYQDGVGLYGCSACGKTMKDYGGDYEKIAAGHKFPAATQENIKNVLIAPTCSEYGLGTTVCERCGAANSETVKINPTGKHNFGFVTVKATKCDEADITYYYCLNCKAVDPDYAKYLDESKGIVKEGLAGEHKFDKTEVREATCEGKSGTYKVCSVCGEAQWMNGAGTVLDHEERTKVVTEPTCYTEGVKVTYCLRCGKVTKEEAIAKTGHKLVVDEEKSYAGTCVVKGYTVKVCANEGCNYELTEINPNFGEHVYVTEKVWGEADCKTQTIGTEKQYCKYHPTNTQYVISNWNDAHDWVDGEIINNPTCRLNGSKYVVCSKCGAKTIETIKATGHNWATREVAATCMKGAYTETYCTVCDKTGVASATTSMPLGHEWMGKVYVEPTCTENGYWSTKCARCGEEQKDIDFTNPAPALGHDMKKVETVKATCKDGGYDLFKCTRCDKTEQRNATSKLTGENDHNWTPVDETIKVPACNEKAIKVFSVCTVCGAHGMKELHAGHKMAGPFVAKNGNTITAIYNVCTVCGEIELIDTVNGFDGFDGCMTKDEDGNWTGKHTLAGGVVTDATCEEAGHVTKLYCTKCGTLIADEAEIAAKGHTVVEVAEVPATCTEDGVSAYSYCSVCNKEITKKEVLPAGHKLVEVEAAVEATCTEDGKTASKKCENCDYVEESKVVPAKGHKEVILPAVEPTESSTGLTEGKKCEICGLILVEQKEIAAKEAKLIVPAILRAAGYDKATTVARLYTGAEVKILEAMNENGYYKVEVAGKTGYMHKSYIEIL